MASTKGQGATESPLTLEALEDYARDTSVYQAQVAQWVGYCMECADTVAKGGAPASVRAAFWITTFGILVDLRRRLARFNKQAASPRFRHVYGQMLVAIDGVLAPLSRDERLYLEYRRHVDAHPFQSAYETLNSEGVQQSTFRSRLLEAELPLTDARAALGRVIRAANVDEAAIAMSVARRLLNPIRQLHLVTLAYKIERG